MAEKSAKLLSMTEEELNARHADKMRKKKAARDKIQATKTEEKGLVIVHTGKGKGKSTAGFGMVFRALGHGMKIGVVQFVKGSWDTGERWVLEKFPEQVTISALGEGFTWETQDRTRDIAMARGAWEQAKALIMDESYDMVLCDELNIVLRYDYLPVEEVIEVLKAKPEMKHVIITGRNAKDELIEAADLVTEMEMIKHPFRSGVKAQKGIEFQFFLLRIILVKPFHTFAGNVSMLDSWQFWALMSAVFAALTAIFAKIGIQGINSDFATLVRTLVIIGALCLFLTVTGQWQKPGEISARSWLFLVLSGLATGASWLAYFRALQIGDASRVAPIDKLSVVLVALFGAAFLGERMSTINWFGILLIGCGVVLVALRI